MRADSARPGGKNNNPEGFDKGYDIVFTTQFKVSRPV